MGNSISAAHWERTFFKIKSGKRSLGRKYKETFHQELSSDAQSLAFVFCSRFVDRHTDIHSPDFLRNVNSLVDNQKLGYWKKKKIKLHARDFSLRRAVKEWYDEEWEQISSGNYCSCLRERKEKKLECCGESLCRDCYYDAKTCPFCETSLTEFSPCYSFSNYYHADEKCSYYAHCSQKGRVLVVTTLYNGTQGGESRSFINDESLPEKLLPYLREKFPPQEWKLIRN